MRNKRSGVEHLANHPSWKTQAKKSRSKSKRPTLTAELAALHDLQSACQVALRDVPHQKGCLFFNASKPWSYRESCTCVRKPIVDLEKLLADQLG